VAEIILIINKVYGYTVDNGKMTLQEPSGYKWAPSVKTQQLAKHLCACEILTPMFQMKVDQNGVLAPEGVVFFTTAYKDEEPVLFMKLLWQTCISCVFVLRTSPTPGNVLMRSDMSWFHLVGACRWDNHLPTLDMEYQ